MKINNYDDEKRFRAYTAHRDALQNVMEFGAFPNLVRAIELFDAFDEAMAGELADEELAAYHESVMGNVAPHIAMLRQLAEQFVGIMEAIETAAPGTFNITVRPVAVEPEPEPEDED